MRKRNVACQTGSSGEKHFPCYFVWKEVNGKFKREQMLKRQKFLGCNYQFIYGHSIRMLSTFGVELKNKTFM